MPARRPPCCPGLGFPGSGGVRPAPGRGWNWALGLLATFTLLALVPSRAGADTATEAACRESFGRVQRALESRSAEAVVNCMLPEGTLTLTLLGVNTRPEPMKREQALKVLKSYFELVSAPKLVARPGQAADALVRAFDYTRRLRAGDPSTTRLALTLKKDAAGLLRIHSIVETAR